MGHLLGPLWLAGLPQATHGTRFPGFALPVPVPSRALPFDTLDLFVVERIAPGCLQSTKHHHGAVLSLRPQQIAVPGSIAARTRGGE